MKTRIRYGTWLILFLVMGPLTSALAQREARTPQVQSRDRQDVLYLTSEQEQETITYLQKVRPEQSERLIRLKDLRPQQYRTFLSRAYREMRYMNEIKVNNPDRYERLRGEKQLESETQDLAAQYKRTNDDTEKEHIETEMLELLGRLFDMRQVNREEEIVRLEKRLAQLKEAQSERQSHKDEIVQRRLKELTGDKGLVW